MSYTVSKQGFISPSFEEIKRKKLLDAWLGPDSDNLADGLSELQHTPLPAEHIRLVHLMPGNGFDPITVSLENATLRDCKYEALSYCWGNATFLSPIICNGSRLEVTRNLKSALRDLRHHDLLRTLWIDAICINQKDSKEREQQVGIMGDIYSLAERTVVWLGDTFAGIELAFNLVDKMQKLYSADDIHTMPKLQKTIPSDHMPTNEELYALDLLLTRPWFCRIWVIQEATLSKKVLVTCGGQKTTWNKLCYGILLTLIYVKPRSIISNEVRTLHQIWNIRQAIHNSNKRLSLDLLHLLSKFRCCLSTEPRDKLFALLSLTDTNLGEDGDEYHIAPNYSSSTHEIYTCLARFILNSSDTLDLLSIQHGATPISKHLPSWVPDWSDSTAKTPLDKAMNGNGIKVGPFCATGQSSKADVVFKDGQILLLSGHCLDVLQTPSILFPETGLDLGEIAKLKNRTYGHYSNVTFAPLRNPIASLRVYLNLYLSILQLFLWAWRQATRYALQFDVMVQWNEIALGTTKYPTKAIYRLTDESVEIAYMSTINICPALQLDEPTQKKYRTWWQCCHPFAIFRKVKLHKVPGLYNLLITIVAFARSQMRPHEGSQFSTLKESIVGRRLCWTKGRYLGLFPADSKANDEVWLLKGGKLPFVLRKLEDGKYQLIGDCYVRGVMNGERFEEEKCVKVMIV